VGENHEEEDNTTEVEAAINELVQKGGLEEVYDQAHVT
jgi:hypothetical protein